MTYPKRWGIEHWIATAGLVVFVILMVAHCQETARAGGPTLVPQVYLPEIFQVLQPGWTMDLTIENNTDGEICYEVIGTGPITCMQPGRQFYRTLLHGDYRFWAQGCRNDTYIWGLAPFYYKHATLAFACFEDGNNIWAKLYEMASVHARKDKS